MKKYFMATLVIVALTACFKNYYKVRSLNHVTQTQWMDLSRQERIIIIHFNDTVKQLVNTVLQDSTVHGELVDPPFMKTKYLEPKNKNKNPYKFKERELLFAQIHLYINESGRNRASVAINKNNFYKMNLYARNTGASVTSHILGSFLVLLVLTPLVIAAAAPAPEPTPPPTDCNCPQVYLETKPAQYQFQAGMYSGAIMRSMERMDIYPLTGFTPPGDTVKFKITSMPRETQYINYVGMKTVHHPAGTRVVATAEGDLYSINSPVSPTSAWAGHSPLPFGQLHRKDGNAFAFQVADSGSVASELILNFTVPAQQTSALLVLHGRNTDWSGFMYQYFKSFYGNQYAEWIAAQERTHKAGSGAWLDQQGLTLKVSVWDGTAWVQANRFPMIGNTATRDMAMRVSLPANHQGVIRMKIATAFHFWEIDEAGLSLQYEALTQTETLSLSSALLNSQDSGLAIANPDSHYAVLHPSDEIRVGFRKNIEPKNNSHITTYILYMKGYYHQQSPISQPIQGQQLLWMNRSGAFHRLSLQTYRDFGLARQDQFLNNRAIAFQH